MLIHSGVCLTELRVIQTPLNSKIVKTGFLDMFARVFPAKIDS